MATRTADLTDQVDGVRDVFFAPEPYIPGTMVAYLNGIQQQEPDWTIDEGGMAFRTAMVPLLGDSLSIQYEVEVPEGEPGGGDTVVINYPLVNPSSVPPRRRW